MKLDLGNLRVVAFDCVNTVFNVSHIHKEEIKRYIDQVRRPKWGLLDLSREWEYSAPHWDSAAGINRIRERYLTVTCSNLPAGLLSKLSDNGSIYWSAIIPMETRMVYKPNYEAYRNVAKVCGVYPHQVLMVTANETAPDIEVSRSLGFQAILIDRENKYEGLYPTNLIELAEKMGC